MYVVCPCVGRGSLQFTILRSTIPREESRPAEPPMPPTFMECRLHRKCRHCAKLSVIKEVEDVKPNRALAFVVEPSALTVWTWHVVSITGWWPPNCEWCVTVPGIRFGGDTSLVCFGVYLSMWSQVRWGFWHFLQFWPQGWLQSVNTMPVLLKNWHHLPVWQRPELLAGVQGMLSQFTSHTVIINVDVIQRFCGRLLWMSCLMSMVGITYWVLRSTHSKVQEFQQGCV